MSNKDKILYWSPRILAVIFVAFLFLFSLDSFSQFNGWKSILAIIIHLAIPTVVLLVTILAWKRDLLGAIMFCVFAIYYICMVGFDRHWSWYISIAGPALLTALLFFINWLRNKKQNN